MNTFSKPVDGLSSAFSTALIQFQPASVDIWDSKYRLRDVDGIPLDQSMDDTFIRVAKALADVEADSDTRAFWYGRFLWALRNGAVPAGRIMANAGAQQTKKATSTVNCTVSGPISDCMTDILGRNQQAGLTLKAGCGIGYEFSTLRPSGSFVAGAGALTGGPLSFMDVFDKTCFAVSSAGGQRGAQMATFDVGHPDVLAFIKAKREDGRLRQFNLSLLITDEFMDAVQRGSEWPLAFPITRLQQAQQPLDLNDAERVIWREWPLQQDYVTNDAGLVACKITERLPARELWDVIMQSTYDFAEPGFILIDQVNEQNNNWFCENIRSTNSCGEQPLPPFGSSLLGSVNLTHFVRNPFTARASFDWQSFTDVVAVFTRMLDNVVELHGLPLDEQRHEIEHKRRHGMGYMGLGSAVTMLRMSYGDEPSVVFTEAVTKRLALTGWEVGLELAREKGPAPVMEQMFTVTEAMLCKRPEMRRDGHRPGDRLPGRILHACYSRYMQKIAAEKPELVSQLEEVGCRFTHHSSVAPTGTIALSFGNNVSNGIEPSFAHQYSRNVQREGKKSKEKVEVLSYELLAYRELISPDAAESELPDYFISADDIHPKQHVDIQAAAQKWLDAAISKTANVPTDYPYAKFKDIYLYAYRRGLKGCTTFRFNPEAFQGVLVKEDDLKNTRYQFTLSDGREVELAGDAQVEYDGELHTAANLFDALKEGYYGRL